MQTSTSEWASGGSEGTQPLPCPACLWKGSSPWCRHRRLGTLTQAVLLFCLV